MTYDSGKPRIDAVILCGGKLEESLRPLSDAPSKGLIEIAGRPMVDYVIDAVKNVPDINQLVLVANRTDLPNSVADRVDVIAEEGEDMLGSLASAVEMITELPEFLLVLPCDLPLVSPESISHFISQSLNPTVDITYGILSREDSERVFPDVHHTYVQVKEGTFCGSGLFMMRPSMVESCRTLFRNLTIQRKNALGLASLLGPVFIVKLLTKTLSVQEAEKKLLELMGNCTGRAIRTPYAEAGFNVDAPNELEIARRLLEKR